MVRPSLRLRTLIQRSFAGAGHLITVIRCESQNKVVAAALREETQIEVELKPAAVIVGDYSS